MECPAYGIPAEKCPTCGALQRSAFLRKARCLRCHYAWYPRSQRPTMCPHCKSRVWFKARQK